MQRRVSLLLPVLALLAVGLWFLLAESSSPAPAPVPVQAPGTSPAEPPRVDLAPTATAAPTPPLGPVSPPTPPEAPDESQQSGQERGTAAAVVLQTGRVQDPAGRPLVGAVIAELWLRSTPSVRRLRVTDVAGRFTLIALPRDGLLLVSAGGFASRVVPLGEASERELVVVLVPARALHGTVLSLEDAQPLEKARVVAESNSWREEVLTDPLGRFRLEAPPEAVSLIVSFPQRITVACLEEELPTIELARGRSVEGLVVDAKERPLRGAVVAVIGVGQLTTPHLTQTDSTGRFRIEGGIAPGEAFTVLAFSYEYASRLDAEFPWPPGEDEITIQTWERGNVELTGGPPRGALCPEPLQAPPGLVPNPYLRPQSTRAGQVVTFTRLAPGWYQMAMDGRRIGELFEVLAGETTRLSWRSLNKTKRAPTGSAESEELPLQSVRVRVVDAGGAPLEGAQVVASSADVDHVAQTDRNGEVVLEGLTAGHWVFVASLPGRVLRAAASHEGNDPAEIVLTLSLPVSLRGRVVPAQPTHVLLATNGREVRNEVTKADGRFVLRDLAAGPYTLEVSPEYGTPVSLLVTLPLEGELTIHVERAADPHGSEEGHDH